MSNYSVPKRPLRVTLGWTSRGLNQVVRPRPDLGSQGNPYTRRESFHQRSALRTELYIQGGVPSRVPPLLTPSRVTRGEFVKPSFSGLTPWVRSWNLFGPLSGREGVVTKLDSSL